eukprot:6768894-Alexandrium_andersonii.AAC.1
MEVLKVTGKCYPVPMIGACLASVLRAAFAATPVPARVTTKSAGSILAWVNSNTDSSVGAKRRLRQKTAAPVAPQAPAASSSSSSVSSVGVALADAAL